MNASPFRAVVIPAGSTATFTSQPIDCSAYTNLTAYFTSVGTTSGGTIITEEADYEPLQDQPYLGTWSQIESRAASTVSGGLQLAVHFPAACYAFVRFRISSAVTGGGSLKVVLRGVE